MVMDIVKFEDIGFLDGCDVLIIIDYWVFGYYGD